MNSARPSTSVEPAGRPAFSSAGSGLRETTITAQCGCPPPGTARRRQATSSSQRVHSPTFRASLSSCSTASSMRDPFCRRSGRRRARRRPDLRQKGSLMEDAVEQLDQLARNVGECTCCDLRAPRTKEQDDCYPFLSKELTITTPHYVLPVGEETARYLLGRLFKDLPYKKGDSLELRLFDNPAFKIVPVATPDELRERDANARKEYGDRLRALARVMGL